MILVGVQFPLPHHLDVRGYEIRGDWIHAKYPNPLFGSQKGWKSYRPLEDAPDLFLKLASLGRKPNFEESSLAFSHKYGVPGGVSYRSGGWLDKMPLSPFHEEAKRAWGILKMYEAVLNRDWEAAKLFRSEHLDELVDLDPSLLSSFDKHVSQEDAPGMYLQDALIGAVIMVEETVGKLCRPGSFFTEGVFFPEVDPSGVKGIWQFGNLLGAAYLQIYWLMTSGGDIARCEYCGRVISLARPHPDGRKRRRDRRFCDDACRQANHRSKQK